MNTVQNQAASAITPSVTSGGVTKKQTDVQSMSSNFLKMLVAQLRYQDPTNPVNSAEMTSQLAQISTVQGISEMNAGFTTMLDSLKTSQLYQSSNLIGRTVATPGSGVTLSNGLSQFGINLPAAADSVSASIMNANGQVVSTLTFGAQPAGVLPVSWSGMSSSGSKLPDGVYSVQVSALSAGQPLSVTSLQYDQVLGVANTSNGVIVNLPGNRSVSSASISQIL
jgi:flagellar basal-body rod modification protein FlgD